MEDLQNIRSQLAEDMHDVAIEETIALETEQLPKLSLEIRARETMRLNKEAVAHSEAFLVRTRSFREASQERVIRITRRLRAAGIDI
ncbi:MAG TPA: hypothetical protein VN778_00450 [Verrucomicrobiae bacterium]|nr:hypothetical protein [Verrucomicrobiae bacterium]